MSEIDPVVVELRAEVAKYRSDLDAAVAKFDSSVRVIERKATNAERVTSAAFTKIGGAIKSAAAAAGISAAAIGAAIGTAVVATLRYANALKDQSEKLGVTTTALQEYRYAASSVRVAEGDMEKGLGSLTQILGKAALGAEQPVKIFKALGINITDSAGKVRDASDVFPQLADRLNAIKDPAKRAATATLIFGENAAALRPLLDRGSAGIDNLRNAAQRLGVVLGEREIQNADEVARKLNDVAMVLKADISAAVINNANSILTLAGALGTLAKFIAEHPTAVAMLTGGAVGARFGLPGMAAGALGGKLLGDAVTSNADDGNMDVPHRMQRLREAQQELGRRDEYARRRPTGSFFNVRQTNSSQPGGTVQSAEGEVKRQAALLEHAVRIKNDAASTPTSTGGPPQVDSILAPKGAGAKKPKEDHSDEYQARYENSLSRLQDEYLQAFAAMTQSAQDRLKSEQSKIETDRVAYNRQVEVDDKLNAVQKQSLIAANNKVAVQQALALAAEEERRVAQEHYDSMVEGIQTTEDYARANADLLTSRKGQLASQLVLLDLMRQREEAELDLVIATRDSASAAYADAKARKEALGDIYAKRAKGVERANESPMERYRREIAGVGENINDEFEKVNVDGLEALNDGLTDAIMGAKSLGDAFKGVANQIISDLIRIAIQQAIIKPLATSLFGGGGGGGGFIGSVVGSLFGRASGGYVPAGQMVRVNEGGSPGRVEAFRPTGSGHIIPLGRMDAARSATIIQPIINVDARGAVMNDQFAAMILAKANQTAAGHATRAGTESYHQSMRDAPAAVRRNQRFGGGR